MSFSDRPQPSTVWPSFANSAVMARPSPRVAPVMTTILFSVVPMQGYNPRNSWKIK